MMQEANEGPIIIINVTDIAANAMILSSGQAKSISLPEVSLETSPRHFQQKYGQYVAVHSGTCISEILKVKMKKNRLTQITLAGCGARLCSQCLLS